MSLLMVLGKSLASSALEKPLHQRRCGVDGDALTAGGSPNIAAASDGLSRTQIVLDRELLWKGAPPLCPCSQPTACGPDPLGWERQEGLTQLGLAQKAKSRLPS